MYNMRERQKIADSNASQNPQFCFLKEQINQEGNSLWGSIWISFHLMYSQTSYHSKNTFEVLAVKHQMVDYFFCIC